MPEKTQRSTTPVRIVLFVTAALVIFGVIGYLVWARRQATPQATLDRVMLALENGDRAAVRRELDFLQQRDDCKLECELMEAGLLLIDQQHKAALTELNAVEAPEQIAKYHSLLAAVALMGLEQFDEAEQRLNQVLASDPDNSMAKRGMQQLAALKPPKTKEEIFISRIKPAVDAFCGDCHATPLPESFPRSQWAKEVNLGYSFYGLFERHDLIVPDFDLVLQYFELQAPEFLTAKPELIPETTAASGIFERIEPAAPNTLNPAIAHVAWGSLQKGEEPVALISDMRYGKVLAIDPKHPDRPAKSLGQLQNPCHTTKCDLDDDGNTDLLVADLGSFYPEDHRKGRVVCLKSNGNGGYDAVVLLEKVGRVCDVQPGDFDGDGDQDLIVAEFGWRTTGRVLYLQNVSQTPRQMKFQMREIDPRHGTIHVPVIDLNMDGQLDFVALITQEHEIIVAFLGDGQGHFSAQTLYSANDPSYGSSGIQLVDLDQDDDIDILYTNGDSFDSDLRKPYHGVQWLENQGQLKFVHHALVNCYGAYRAHAEDFDKDGDQDILVVMALPIKGMDPKVVEQSESILYLINDGQQNFQKQVIERGNCLHATCDVGDFDGDGDGDLIVGRLNVFDADIKIPMVDFWRNQANQTP